MLPQRDFCLSDRASGAAPAERDERALHLEVGSKPALSLQRTVELGET
jgi:hypothetical protein